MKKTITIVILLSICISAFSQVGYMGKRFLINADVRVTPAWLRPNFNGEKGYTKFNYFLEPSLEFIVAKKMSVGATYLNTKGLFSVAAYAEGYVEEKTPTYIVQHPFYIDNDISGNKFISHGVGVFYKYYLGEKSIAPYGYYLKAQFDCFFYNYKVNAIDVKDYLSNEQYKGYSYILYPETTGKSSQFGLKVEFGRDFLFFNRLRLSTGISFGWAFKGYYYGAFSNDLEFVRDSRKKPYSYIYDFNNSGKNIVPPSNFVNGQLFGMYWFGLKMGIGFLAF